MAQYWIDVADLADLTDFTVVNGSISLTTLDGYPVIATNATGTTFYVTGIAAVANAHVAMLMRQTSTRAGDHRTQGPGLRITDYDNQYFFGNSATVIRSIRKRVAGSESLIGSYTTGLDVTAWHWNAFDAAGTALEGRTWTGDITDIPASPLISETDASLSSGRVGFGAANIAAREQYIRIIAIATDGDPLPTGPVGGGTTHSTSGTLAAGAAAVAGTARLLKTHSASGTLAAGSAQVAGTARLLKTHAASGTLAAGSATVGGAASRSEPASTTHTASGALAAGSAQVDGAALRFAVHSASGVLEAGAAQVDGAALRVVPVHTASGALTAGSATVLGTARRYATHTASGALIAGSAIVVGEAAKFAIHAADGTLTAGSATVAGTARLLKTHTASGVLTAGPATIAGTAGNAGTLTLTPADIQAVADAVWADPRALTVAKFLGLK